MTRPLRILLIGGDTALWVGLSTSLAPGSSRIVAGEDVDLSELTIATSDFDAIVVVTNHSEPDPCAPLRLIRKAALERRTVVIANAADQRTAA